MVRQTAGLIVIGLVVGVVVALGLSEQQANKYDLFGSTPVPATAYRRPVTGAAYQRPPGIDRGGGAGTDRGGGARNDRGSGPNLRAGATRRKRSRRTWAVPLPEVQTRHAATRLGAGYTASRIKSDVQVKVRGEYPNIVDVKASAATPRPRPGSRTRWPTSSSPFGARGCAIRFRAQSRG